MSDTPRTAHALKYADSIADMGEWMGALERELAAATALILVDDTYQMTPLQAVDYYRDQARAATARVAELEKAGITADAAMEELGRLLKEATARAESAERDALMRAAEVCEAIANSPQSTAEKILIATDIKHAILALIPKERT